MISREGATPPILPEVRKNREPTLAVDNVTFVQLPAEWSYQQVIEYMVENGIERAFQDKVDIPVESIAVDEDVVDKEHLEEIRNLDLDNQVEPVSLAACLNIDGDVYYEVTNGLHRVTVRKEQGEHLAIKACVRYGMTESEINEMRLKDLNSQLTAVLFLRIAKWLTAAFTNRNWKNHELDQIIDSGQISIAQAVDFTAHESSKTSFKVKSNGESRTLSQEEKAEIVAWIKEVTRSIHIKHLHLKTYMDVAAVAPEALIKMVQIKSGGGGKEGKGKITFELLKYFAAVFGENFPDLQLVVADACIQQNLTATLIKDTTVLEEVRELYVLSQGNLLNPDLVKYIKNLKSTCLAIHQRAHHNQQNHSAPRSDRIPQKSSHPDSSSASFVSSGTLTPHQSRKVSFFESASAGLLDEDGAVIMLQLGDEPNEYALFDSLTRILLSGDERFSAQLSPSEAALLIAAYRGRSDATALSRENLIRLFSDAKNADEKAWLTINNLLTKLKAFKRKVTGV